MQPLLVRTFEGLTLQSELGSLLIDFVNDRANYERPLKKGKSEIIARALGINKGLTDILDLTAGLAQDAAVFARLGCRVRAVERSPLIFPLLEDARLRALTKKEWVKNLEFIFSDSFSFLQKLKVSELPQVIYIDPMFPEKKKTALPRKEMQIFRELIGEDQDSSQLVALAQEKALDRVVVKRPLKAPDLAPGVTHRFEGNSVRYDLYLSKRAEKERCP